MRSLVPCGSLREPRAFSEARLHSSRREDNYPHFAGPLFNARSPLSRTAVVVTTATSPIVTIKPATVRGPRRREAPGMPRGARVLRSQPGLWGGGRGSGPACAPPPRGGDGSASRVLGRRGHGPPRWFCLAWAASVIVEPCVTAEHTPPGAPATGCWLPLQEIWREAGPTSPPSVVGIPSL